MRNLVLILSLIFPLFASALKYKDFTKQIYVVDVGQFKLKYSFSGEPVSRPRSLQIWVKCIGSKEWEPVGEYKMCELTKYEFLAKEKKLVIEYIDGRVEDRTGKSFCDQMGNGELPLADTCKKKSTGVEGSNPAAPDTSVGTR